MRRATIVFLAALSAAFAWSNRNGGDHAGNDWTLTSGDTISGYHFNVGTCSLPVGATVYVYQWDGSDSATGQVRIAAQDIKFFGTLDASGRGYGGGGGGQNDPSPNIKGGRGGIGGIGGRGAQGTFGGSPTGGAGGGGGGSMNGPGGLGGTNGNPGQNGTITSGGTGGSAGSYSGGIGGTVTGGGGGGGAGNMGCGGGGGGGGTGGDTAPSANGGNGGGPWRGSGGTGSSGNNPTSGAHGGYLSYGGNGDGTTFPDSSVVRGSGGGGGGSAWSGSYGGGGGGGGAGGGAIRLEAVDVLTMSGSILSRGASGGQGGGPTFSNVYGGGGAGGGVLFVAGSVNLTGGQIDVRGRNPTGLTTANGGTMKVFYTNYAGPASAYCGRLYLHQYPILDVGVTRILAPYGIVDSGAHATPACSVYNYGNNTVSYQVMMRIGTAYSCTVTVTGQLYGTRKYVTFPADTFRERGNLAVACSTILDGDVQPSNDRRTGSVLVRVTDVGAYVICAPAGMVNYGATVTPRAVIRNYGNVDVALTMTLTIGSGYTSTIAGFVRGSADSAFNFSPIWTANVPGSEIVKCTTLLAGDVNPANDMTDTVVTVNAHDVGVVAILSPAPTVPPGSLNPAVTVRNSGNVRESNVTVAFRINSSPPYTQTRTLTDGLPPGVDTVISFSSWTANPGTYTARCSTWLSGDQIHGNDTMDQTVQVGYVDVGVPSILGPSNLLDTGAIISPQAVIRNYGARSATFRTMFRIVNAAHTVAYADTDWITLAGGASSPHTFALWPKPHDIGAYAMTCSTIVSADTYPVNDAVGGTFEITGPENQLGWTRCADVPYGLKGKRVKDGGCLCVQNQAGTDFIYALKGNNTCEFYIFNTGDDSWVTLESIPVFGASGRKKPVKKGSTMAIDSAQGAIYAAKGNNTTEFWRYEPSDDAYPWSPLPDVPFGSKALKEGGGSAVVTVNDTDYVYLLKGSGTFEFYRYNTASGNWERMADAPPGNSGKSYKSGSAITYDPDNGLIYALKGNYNEFAAYQVANNTWSSLSPLPIVGRSGKRKAKDGASIAYHNSSIYALKGNNTIEFWHYLVDTDKWTESNDFPVGGGKKVKGGGALVCAPRDRAYYALKGNNTVEFYRFGVEMDYRSPLKSDPSGSAQSSIFDPQSSIGNLRVAPNPFTNAATINFTLPEPAVCRLSLYDVTGKLVTTLASGRYNAGTPSFVVRRSSLSPGIYLLKLEAGTATSTTKLIIGE